MDRFLFVFDCVAPVFAIIAIGWLFARRLKLHADSLIDLIVYVGQPCLVLDALTTHRPPAHSVLLVLTGCLVVLAATALVAFLWTRISKDVTRETFVCPMFPNVANLPLPLALFAFGEHGLALQVIYMVASMTLLYTLGVAIASGGRLGLKGLLRFPLVWATLLGLALAGFRIELPTAIQRPVDMLGNIAIPLLLFTLGYRLATTSIAAFRPGLAIAAIRLLGGALAALLFVLLLAPSTPVKQAVLLNCFMPCAVQTFMLSAKFSRTSDRAAAGVFISTAAALFYIPFLIAWLSALS